MASNSASRKANEVLREKISNILLFHVSDPRLQMLTVTGVEVSRDKSVANIYVSASEDRYDSIERGLQAAKGRIRLILAKELDWRVTPELRFHIDKSVDNAQRIARVLEDENKWHKSISDQQHNL